MSTQIPTPDPEEIAAAIESINETFAALAETVAEIGRGIAAHYEEIARIVAESEETR